MKLAALALALALGLAPVVRAESDAPFYFALAQAYIHERSYALAIESFEKAVELEPREPYLRMEFAELLLRLGKTETAALHADAARSLAPGNTDALRLFAFVHRRLGDAAPQSNEIALQAFAELHEMAPEDAEAALALAQLYLEDDRFEEAAMALEETLELRPRSRILMSLLAETLDKQGRPERAESHLRSFLASNPRYLQGRLALAELLTRRGEHAERAPGDQRTAAELRRNLTLALYRSGAPERALVEVEGWLADEPSAVGGRFLRATLLATLGKDAAAEQELETILAERPYDFRAISLLAEILERGERREEAATILRAGAQALEARDEFGAAAQILLRLLDLQMRDGAWPEVLALTPRLEDLLGPDGGAEVGLVRAQALAELERREEALETLARLREEDRVAGRAIAAHAELSFELGRRGQAIGALVELGSSSDLGDVMLAAESLQRLELYGESIPILERADAMSSGSPEVLFWLGAAYERKGRFAEAERQFRRVLDARPDFAPALNYLGYMWAERGENLLEAIDLVSQAVEIEPENGAYIDSLGWAYYQLGRYEEARGHLEKAAALVGEDAVVLEHLGDVYVAVGELELGRLHYQRALALGDDNAETLRRKLRELDSAL